VGRVAIALGLPINYKRPLTKIAHLCEQMVRTLPHLAQCPHYYCLTFSRRNGSLRFPCPFPSLLPPKSAWSRARIVI